MYKIMRKRTRPSIHTWFFGFYTTDNDGVEPSFWIEGPNTAHDVPCLFKTKAEAEFVMNSLEPNELFKMYVDEVVP